MLEYSTADWAEVFGLVLPFSLVCYLALALTAKLISRILSYNFKKEWPNHWAAILLSPLASFGVLAFMIIKSEVRKAQFDRYLTFGEHPDTLYLWVGGVAGVLIAISIAHSLKKAE